MSIWFYALFSMVLIISIFLTIKIFMIKKSIREINSLLKEKIKLDTNTLITVSSNDKEINNLANELNKELKELRKQKLQYQFGNNELKTTITNISHDLRTPLTAISGYVELLEKENDYKKQKEYIKIVNNKTNELIFLTEQLFYFSKSLDFDKEIKKEKCCINELLEETLVSYYTLFKENNITPNIEICNEKVYRNINKNMIIRVFENIISNAIKYSDNECNIKLQEDGKIIFSNKASTLDLTSVKKIFDRYYTVENAKKNSGVGLSIAKQLVELNDGNIVAKYEKNNLIIEMMF